MNSLKQKIRFIHQHQSGAAAVEFALVSALFFSLLFGMMELARMLSYWNSAAEATRFAARTAIVCDIGYAPKIKERMQSRLAILTPSKIQISYEPAGCTVDSCQSVTVSILDGVSVKTIIPYLPLTLTLPPFSTTLPRESMLSIVEKELNPVCK